MKKPTNRVLCPVCHVPHYADEHVRNVRSMTCAGCRHKPPPSKPNRGAGPKKAPAKRKAAPAESHVPVTEDN